MKKKNTERLDYWQNKLRAYKTSWEDESILMDGRESILLGERNTIDAIVTGDVVTTTQHLRNLAGEIIESEVDSNVPLPKVSSYYKKYEQLAVLVEDMIRNKLDKWPSEELNDQLERTVPAQGGAFTLLEWDNTKKTHSYVGESILSFVHPKLITPQPGVTSSLEDMDSFILRFPHTKKYIKNHYGVDVEDEGEDEPGVRGSGDVDESDDMVTQYIAYYRNSKGGIGMFSWVGDKVLADYIDYQARRLPVCTKCGRTMNTEQIEPMSMPTIDGAWPGGATGDYSLDKGMLSMTPTAALEGVADEVSKPKRKKSSGEVCIYCGNDKFEEADAEFEEIWEPVTIPSLDEESPDRVIPGAEWKDTEEQETDISGKPLFDAMGLPVMIKELVPTKIPYYKPDLYPVFLHKNISMWGQLLGESDIDIISDQQNSYNRLAQKVLDETLSGGSYITLPNDPAIRIDTSSGKIIRLSKPEHKAMIDVFTLQANIAQPLELMQYFYEEARQLIGITDSYQGRKDSTATSGKAKEFAAAQSAGRMESKRVMKRSAWSHIFEAIFKFELAYADEPRPIVGYDKNGNHRDEEWNKYQFLEQDETGEWYWNDQFLFSCDAAAPLVQNRDAMWGELRSMFIEGDFGDPTATDTQIMYWQAMEEWHYPGASKTKKFLVEKRQKEAELQAAQAQAQVNAIQYAKQQTGQSIPQGGGML